MLLQQKKPKYKKMQKGKLTKLNFRSNKLKSQKKNFSTGGTMLAIKTASIL